MIITSVELYTFIAVLMTLIYFQDNVRTFALLVLCKVPEADDFKISCDLLEYLT